MTKFVQGFKSLLQNIKFETKKSVWVYYVLSILLLVATNINWVVFLLLLFQAHLIMFVTLFLLMLCGAFISFIEIFKSLIRRKRKHIKDYFLFFGLCMLVVIAFIVPFADSYKTWTKFLSESIHNPKHFFIWVFLALYLFESLRISFFNVFDDILIKYNKKFKPKAKENKNCYDIILGRISLTIYAIVTLIPIFIGIGTLLLIFSPLTFWQTLHILKNILLLFASIVYLLPIKSIKNSEKAKRAVRGE